MTTEVELVLSQAKEHQEPPKARRGKEGSSPRAWGGYMALRTSYFRLLGLANASSPTMNAFPRPYMTCPPPPKATASFPSQGRSPHPLSSYRAHQGCSSALRPQEVAQTCRGELARPLGDTSFSPASPALSSTKESLGQAGLLRPPGTPGTVLDAETTAGTGNPAPCPYGAPVWQGQWAVSRARPRASPELPPRGPSWRR